MDAKTTIASIRAALNDLVRNGQEFVSVSALLEYLTTLDKDAQVDPEIRKLSHESSLAKYRADHETNLEMFKSVIEAGRTAVASCILINGGATVALLAYLGNFLSKNPDASAPSALTLALVVFAVGVLLGAVASGMRYFTQYCYGSDWNVAGSILNVVTIIVGLSTYVMFGIGVWNSYVAFS
jgi:hypothetical protein